MAESLETFSLNRKNDLHQNFVFAAPRTRNEYFELMDVWVSLYKEKIPTFVVIDVTDPTEFTSLAVTMCSLDCGRSPGFLLDPPRVMVVDDPSHLSCLVAVIEAGSHSLRDLSSHLQMSLLVGTQSWNDVSQFHFDDMDLGNENLIGISDLLRRGLMGLWAQEPHTPGSRVADLCVNAAYPRVRDREEQWKPVVLVITDVGDGTGTSLINLRYVPFPVATWKLPEIPRGLVDDKLLTLPCYTYVPSVFVAAVALVASMGDRLQGWLQLLTEFWSVAGEGRRTLFQNVVERWWSDSWDEIFLRRPNEDGLHRIFDQADDILNDVEACSTDELQAGRDWLQARLDRLQVSDGSDRDWSHVAIVAGLSVAINVVDEALWRSDGPDF